MNSVTKTAGPEATPRRVVEGVVRGDLGYSTILPRDYYVSAQIFEKEFAKVFSRQWIFIGHASRIPGIGDYVVQEFAGESIVVIRESADKINGFLNVCRHRGHSLCSATQGNLRKFVCPYHHWTYGIDGALKQAPGSPDGSSFDYKDWSLKRVRIQAFHGFLFAWLGNSEPPDLAQKFAGADSELKRYAVEDLKEIHRESYDIQANWKTLLENYLECYHCSGSHPELCKAMDLQAMYAGTDEWQDPYFTGILPLKAGMVTVSMDGQPVSTPLGEFADMPALPAGNGTGFGVVPTLSRVIVHVDHAVAHAIRPVSPGSVRWETCWYVHRDAVEDRDYELDKVIAVWRATNREDIALCENAYRGVTSRRFSPGPLDNKRESAIPAALRTYLAMMQDE
jgi:phenylpropionate dioxygenase-like ring-hydroxylating dioxygenase large terminal subunit